MARKRNMPKRLLTLEERLAEHDRDPPDGPTYGGLWEDGSDTKLQDITPERMAWARKRLELVDAIRRRDAKRLADPGRDASGNFDVSPYAARGNRVDVAPKTLGKELSKDSSFPKRIATQRVIDRYRAHGHITPAEWHAANTLWEIWCSSGLEAKITSGYEPVTTHGQANQDHKIAKRVDAITAFVVLIDDVVPYHCRGVVKAVVIEDRSASDWALGRGRGRRDSERHGMVRLRAGLSALSEHFGY